MRTFVFLALLCLSGMSANFVHAAGGPATTDPKKADADFAIQGEYVSEGDGEKWGLQVIALSKGEFQGTAYAGGLPGAGWAKNATYKFMGKTEGDKTLLKGPDGMTIAITGDAATVSQSNGDVLGKMKKIVRTSPTMGAKPPEGATILFDGKATDHFPGAKISEEGLLQAGATASDKVQSYTAHIEFLLPYMPESRGQGRGNSGFYIQGRYELQMLDSFGLEGLDNECGGIYQIARPSENMCLPPLQWQTYDVDFTAPVYEGDKKVKNARATIKHNGVVIHDDLELPKNTPGGVDGEKKEPGTAMLLQDHGNPVQYRNIWVVPKN